MPEVAEEERISFAEWSRVIFKKWKIILAIFVIAFFVPFSFNYYNSRKKAKRQVLMYSTKSTIMIGPEALEVVTREGQIVRRVYSYSSELSLLESSIVAQQAAAILKERHGYEEPEDELVSLVRDALNVLPYESETSYHGNIVSIEVIAPDPNKAFDLINAVIDGYRKQKREDEEKFFKDTYQTFTRQLNTARENLHKSEQDLTDFIMENEEIAEVIKSYGISGEKEERVLSEDSGINEKYLRVKSEISSSTDFLSSIEELLKKDKIQAFAQIATRYGQFVDLKLKDILMTKEEELSRLLLVNEEAHPEVIRARGELRSIENKIDSEIENAVKSMRLDLDRLRSQEKELSRMIGADVHKKIIAYNLLKRDIVVKRQIYNRLTEELQQLNLGERLKRYSEIRVLEPPKLPSEPFNPMKVNLAQIILFSLSIAAFSSIASVYLMEMLDTSIRDVEQLEKLIEIPVLVMIPWHRRHKPPRQKFWWWGKPRKDRREK